MEKQNQSEFINQEAEQAILALILLDPDLIKECYLKPSDFYETRNQIIFKAMLNLYQKNMEIDVVLIVSELNDEETRIIGRTDYLAELSGAFSSTTNFMMYQKWVKNANKVRLAMKSAQNFLNAPKLNSLGVMTKYFSELIEDLIVTSSNTEELLMEIYNEIHNPKQGLSGVDTGYKELNIMTDGFQPGDLIIMAARPSVGKTALALNLALNATIYNSKAIFYSFEMSEKQLLYRLLSIVSDVNSAFLQRNSKLLTSDEIKNVDNAYPKMINLGIEIEEEAIRYSVEELAINIRNRVKNNGGKQCLVIIDYLQLIKTDNTLMRHDLKIGQITRELKLLAKELNTPIILLSQLNRGVESRMDKRPMMSDLRDSGSIEQDADIIMLLHREDYYNQSSNVFSKIEVNLAKHRNGPVGPIYLNFNKSTGTFKDIN